MANAMLTLVQNLLAKAMNMYGQEIPRHRAPYQTNDGIVSPADTPFLGIVLDERIRHILDIQEVGLTNVSDPQPYDVIAQGGVDVQATDEITFNGLTWIVTEVDPIPLYGTSLYVIIRTILASNDPTQ
jgi:hypothetical protein